MAERKRVTLPMLFQKVAEGVPEWRAAGLAVEAADA